MDKENNDDESVQVKKSDLNRLMDTISRQSKDIEVLYKATDKSRLASVRQSDSSAKLIHTCKIWQWRNGKIIVVWKLTKNVSEIVQGKWYEEQASSLVFEDGSMEEGVSLLDFYRHKIPVIVEILSRKATANDKGEETNILEVLFPDGKKLQVGEMFIN